MDHFVYLLLSKAQWYYRERQRVLTLSKKWILYTSLLGISLLSPYLVLQAGSNKRYRPFTNIFEPGLVLLHLMLQERECEIWGTVQSWASNFYLHTHMQSIHVNITFVGTSVIYFIMFDARSIAVLSSTCFSTLSLWLFLDTYWSFFLYFYQAKYVLIFTEM